MVGARFGPEPVRSGLGQERRRREEAWRCSSLAGVREQGARPPCRSKIWSDVVCPWCAIGRARFEQAVDGWEHADEVDVRWRSFELDPGRPSTTDVEYLDMLASKYRTSREQAQAMVDRMTEAGAAEGIAFDFTNARPGNTFDAHRVLHLAAERGRQHEVKARFLAGYHSEGAPIADHGALTTARRRERTRRGRGS